MTNSLTLDEVLFEFHKTVDVPTPADVARWTKDYPQFAEEIRAHAVEIIDMEALAQGYGDANVEAAAPRQGTAEGWANVPAVGASTLRQVVRAKAGLSLADFADELGITPVIVADINSGRINAETVSRKFLRKAAERLGQTVAEFTATVFGPKEAPATAMLKATMLPSTGRPMTWEEAVRGSDMDDEQMAFWLSDEE